MPPARRVLVEDIFFDFFKVFFAMSLFSLSICPSGAMPVYMQSTRHLSTVSFSAVSVVKCACTDWCGFDLLRGTFHPSLTYSTEVNFSTL